MVIKQTLIALSLIVSACSSAPPVVAPNEVTVQSNISWTFPNLKVNRVTCRGAYADCLQEVGKLCEPNGAVAQQVDDHDAVFLCKPKQKAAEAE